jgi:hypothetical protein
MTNLQANRLYATLAELSKPITISKEGKPTEVRLSFSGKTCLAIARMKSKLTPHVTACEEAVNAVIAAHGGRVPPDHPAFAEVVKQITEINQSTCDVGDLGTLSLAEFEAQETLPDLEPLLPYLQ